MTTIYEDTKTALATLVGIPCAQDAYLTASNAALPDVYLVYTVIDGTPLQHAEDTERLRVYQVQISIYSRAGLVSLPNVDGAMTAAGFSRGPEREIPRDMHQGHYCLAKDYYLVKES